MDFLEESAPDALPEPIAVQKMDQETLTALIRRRVSVELKKLEKYERLGVASVFDSQERETDLFQTILHFLENPEALKQKPHLEVVRKPLKKNAA